MGDRRTVSRVVVAGCLAVLALGAVGLPAQEQPSPDEPSEGGRFTPPQVVERRMPQYPEQARRAKLAGTVAVQGVVQPSGEFEPRRVVRRLPLGLTQLALQAMRTWQIEPARRDGQPVAVNYTLTVTYSMMGERYLKRPLRLLEGGGVEWPEGTQTGASALLDVRVDREGFVTDVEAVETEEELGRAVVAAAAQWRFEAPEKKRARFFYTVLAPSVD